MLVKYGGRKYCFELKLTYCFSCKDHEMLVSYMSCQLYSVTLGNGRYSKIFHIFEYLNAVLDLLEWSISVNCAMIFDNHL